jgi:hypothetical protein
VLPVYSVEEERENQLYIMWTVKSFLKNRSSKNPLTILHSLIGLNHKKMWGL